MEHLVESQQHFFRSLATRDIAFRRQMLKKLKQSIIKNEESLYEALLIDLGKNRTESYMAEISLVLSEIDEMSRKVSKWSKPKKVKTTLGIFPAKNRIYMEPYGVVLVLAPWNYPFLLAMSPLVGAICAGNCVVLKCSKSSPNCARVIQKIVNETFPSKYAYCVDADLNYDDVLMQNYNYIFFTGSPRVGKQIMSAASQRLIPLSLELGGKSPCIVEKTANIQMAAKRIVWGKLLNAGQTCITTDYILVDNRVKNELIQAMQQEVHKRYTKPECNDQYPRIISQHHYERLVNLIEDEKKYGGVLGGELNVDQRKIAPVFMTNADFDHKVMEEEIFGPLLPVIGYDDLNKVVEQVNDRPHPLACYIFSEDKKIIKELLKRIPFGGGCVNDTILHISNHHMPFGGVGNSGMGGYHGKYSFETFSHQKSVVENTTHIDIPVRYAPYSDKKWKLIRKIL